MTNKEAIANLNHIYCIVSSDIQRSLDIAIKALEERPQDDCEGCKYDNKASTEYPCSVCKNNHPNMFEWRGNENDK